MWIGFMSHAVSLRLLHRRAYTLIMDSMRSGLSAASDSTRWGVIICVGVVALVGRGLRRTASPHIFLTGLIIVVYIDVS